MNIAQKNVAWNAIGSTANAFTSLIFVIIATRINGVDKAGIFSFAFATACILFVLAGYIVRAFQVTDLTGSFTDTDYFYNRIITCAVMLMVAVAFVLIRGYNIYKATIILLLCLFKCAEAFAEVLYGFMQKSNKLYVVGVSLFCKAACAIICFLLVDLITKNLLYSCIMLVLSYVLFIIILDIPVIKKLELVKSGFSLKTNNRLLKVGFFTFVITILGIYLVNAPRYVIDSSYENSVQTIYGIIIMPATFMSLLGQYIIQPCLMRISQCIAERNYNSLKGLLSKIFLLMAGFGIAVFGVAFFLEEPVLSFIYGIDLSDYKPQMMIIIVGSILYGLETISSYILIAFRRTGIQAIIFTAMSLLATGLSWMLVKRFEIIGAACAYLLVMALLTIAFFICLAVSMKKYKKDWLIEGMCK